jgi:hypothetical protein
MSNINELGVSNRLVEIDKVDENKVITFHYCSGYRAH